ncbi:phospholipase D-like domain-containing protein [Roseomonas sp. CCTCC AB2023176]|uniref:phospholipase D-like domain-containing protein n=1 Tax=Roseomonas sp. CCTCC AB2023176 TaxID=3342640 RepID=UPI0035DC6E72
MLITPPGRLRRAHPDGSAPGSLLRPGRNVWRATRAGRAAVLSDGATYFGALRQAMLNARRTIHVAGWDIDSRMRLVGDLPAGQAPADGLPDTLGAFLSALTDLNPDLTIRLLLWDYSVLYAIERELLPVLSLRWNTPPRVELCLDAETPFGASHHQKVVVVDDKVAFCGGLDLTIRRWDTQRHDPDDPRRVDPAGKPYPPFHDVQAVVDGEAAATLGALFRTRWLRAAGESLTPTETDASHDPWPASTAPDVTDIRTGIARTRPEHRLQTPRREVEALYLDSIATAERHVYLENQFLTCSRIARAMIRRMRQKPGLEVVMVAPKTHHTWLEHRTMLAGRIRFMNLFRRARLTDRVRLLYPHVTGSQSSGAGSEREVMVHAKVMVVDDRLMRVGSSNIANRSMGLDTECDLMFEARDEPQRAAIARMRDRLIGEHLGLSPEDVASRLAQTGSLIAAVDRGGADGHDLLPVKDGRRAVRDFSPASSARPTRAAPSRRARRWPTTSAILTRRRHPAVRGRCCSASRSPSPSRARWRCCGRRRRSRR